MNFIVGLIIGYFLGTVITFFGILAFAKIMSKEKKEAAIEKSKLKWGRR